MKKQNIVEGFIPYSNPAGGWDALKSVAKIVHNQQGIAREIIALFKVNKPQGFDCPGCAWPNPKHSSFFEFCENGAKAISWEATNKCATLDFFAKNTVTELYKRNSCLLEGEGRLIHPMKYEKDTDTYKSITWERAITEIATILQNYEDPNQVEFYTSGRTSNEAAFLWQLFARAYGTNNFPDCSNMCHEPTSVGLPYSIGVGKGTVTLDDFNYSDLVICIGHNPGSNHPRMLHTLRKVSKRGAKILAINPLHERGLEKFISPKCSTEMLSLNATSLASLYYTVRVGGDAALLQGIMKCLLEMDNKCILNNQGSLLDRNFINNHTIGFQSLKLDLEKTDWQQIQTICGIKYQDIYHIAQMYTSAQRTIICYGMGITQHDNGTYNVQQIANLLLMRGNIGKLGSGICPLRGHSNVQGNRTVGITERPSQNFLNNLEKTFNFIPVKKYGHRAVETIQAINSGQSKALLSLGGNLAEAMPDKIFTFKALRKLDLVVHIATKLNRSHLILGKNNYLLPILGRTEIDLQASGPQIITVEDSMSTVHSSRGVLKPISPWLKSEPALIAAIAKKTLLKTKIDWQAMVQNYNLIRDAIEAVVPIFKDFNKRITILKKFSLSNSASHKIWATSSGKAHFMVMPPKCLSLNSIASNKLFLTTIRSHDQYNTTIYGFDDRYRGINGRRDILFIASEEARNHNLNLGDKVNIIAIDNQGNYTNRRMNNLTIIFYNMTLGAVATYYPEANIMISISDHDKISKTPSYKSIPIMIEKVS